MRGKKTFPEAHTLYEKLKYRWSDASFNLTKWRTNDKKLRDIINRNEGVSEEIEVTDTEKKVLGIKWNEYNDMLLIDLHEFIPQVVDKVVKVTKRVVLSIIAGFYDPVGYIQPVVVQFKIFFQLICKKEYNWDDELNEELKERWLALIKSAQNIGKIMIDRCYCVYKVHDPTESVKLIGFSDASKIAYGCCIYFKFVRRSGEIKIRFVTSKSRIVPMKKTVTIPRLELLGNLLLSRLVVSVTSAVEDELSIINKCCFTDSQVSLAWVKADNKELKTFVQNRVIEIRKNVNFY